jgi:hypothetical protein
LKASHLDLAEKSLSIIAGLSASVLSSCALAWCLGAYAGIHVSWHVAWIARFVLLMITASPSVRRPDPDRDYPVLVVAITAAIMACVGWLLAWLLAPDAPYALIVVTP